MTNEVNHKAAFEPPFDCRVGNWPSGYYPGTWTGRDSENTATVNLGQRVYSLGVVAGQVVIYKLTAKDAAISEVRAQPFFAPNARNEGRAALSRVPLD